MTPVLPVTAGTSFMGRLVHGADLLEELQNFCRSHNIRSGRISAIGAVQKARLGYYNQQARRYHFNEIDRPLEIIGLSGNISLRDGEPMVHAHLTLADEKGRAFGGHLAPGNIVFACEFIIDDFGGENFQRSLDETTGLPLWPLKAD